MAKRKKKNLVDPMELNTEQLSLECPLCSATFDHTPLLVIDIENAKTRPPMCESCVVALNSSPKEIVTELLHRIKELERKVRYLYDIPMEPRSQKYAW